MIATIITIYVIALIALGRWAGKATLCPKCKAVMDDDYHGYNSLYNHCHGCGYCTFVKNCMAK